jgi:hypothetical protein
MPVRLLKPSQVAEKLGVSPRTVHAWLAAGKLTSVRLSARVVRIPAEEIERLIAPKRPPLVEPTRETPSLAELHEMREQIVEILASHGVSNPRVFGSVVRGEERPDSDIDMLVDFPQEMSYGDLGDAEIDLATQLGVVFELCGAHELRPHIRAEVLAEAVPL